MAGDVRGHDLESWLKNRADYRDGIAAAAERLCAAADNFSYSAEDAQPEPSPGPAAPSNLIEMGQSLQASLNLLNHQLGSLQALRQQAQSAFAREEAAIRGDCGRRVQAEREEAARKARETAERIGKSKVLVRRLAAAGILAAILYVLAYY